MTHLMKSTALAALTLGGAMSASALTVDLNTMTCTEYNNLTAAQQNAVAVAAVRELNNDSVGTLAPNNGTATATDPLYGEPATESEAGSTTTIADNNGTATDTSTVAAGDDAVRFAEEIAVLNRTCARAGNATMIEAAAGQSGTR